MKGITPQERLEKWNAAICAQKASGLPIKEWCEQNGINSNTYYYYLRRIRDAMLESSGPGWWKWNSLQPIFLPGRVLHRMASSHGLPLPCGIV